MNGAYVNKSVEKQFSIFDTELGVSDKVFYDTVHQFVSINNGNAENESMDFISLQHGSGSSVKTTQVDKTFQLLLNNGITIKIFCFDFMSQFSRKKVHSHKIRKLPREKEMIQTW